MRDRDTRGCSSVGRAPALQAGGHGFESHHLHQPGRPGRQIGSKLPKYTAKQYKVSLVTFLYKESNMLIENRIKKKETKQIVVNVNC